MNIEIRYRGKFSWETELRKKSFKDLKTKTQYCRRNNIKEYELYKDGKRVVMLFDRMIDQELLELKLKEISTALDPETHLAKLKRRSFKWEE